MRLPVIPARLVPLALLVLGVLAFHNSLSGPFLLDDHNGIVDNPTIRNLRDLPTVLSPPRETTVAGRPLLNLSFALNFAAGGLKVRSYHLLNLAIHLLAGLTLYGLVRLSAAATLGARPSSAASGIRDFRPQIQESDARTPVVQGAAVAALWLVHPLNTGAVTYTVQRAESLMGLWYLLTLYCVARSTLPPLPQGEGRGEGPAAHWSAVWQVAAVICCTLGMATKEVMVSAPIVALLYDRTFAAGSFKEALRRRWPLYTALASTWLLLAWLLAQDPRPISAGLHIQGATPLQYALTQLQVIPHYLCLAFWPWPLVLDYSWPIAQWRDVLLPGAVVILILAASAWGLWRNHPLGFLGAAFLLILAPTSSFWPINELAFEHRMYLPLICVIAASLSLWARFRMQVSALSLLIVLAALITLTIRRNALYQDEVALWTDNVARRPAAPRPRYNLGQALARRGDRQAAIAAYHQTLALEPNWHEAHFKLGLSLQNDGQFDAAMGHFFHAIRIRPDMGEAHFWLAVLLTRQDRHHEAEQHLRAALRYNSDYVERMTRQAGK